LGQHRGPAWWTNNDDKESQARVKVKFPTLGDDESAWARVVSPGAGSARGMQWLPEVGDEVMVGFENDDKARPVVLGGLWGPQGQAARGTVHSGRKGEAADPGQPQESRVVLTDDPKSSISVKLGDAGCELLLEQSESKLTGEKKLTITADQIEIKAQPER